MSDEEILAMYLNAKNRPLQIGILADLNVCEPRDIIDVLQSHGIDTSAPQETARGRSTEKRFFWTPEKEQQAFDLFRAGISRKEIAKRIGASYPSVNSKIAKMKGSQDDVIL